jgi:hypothetical protein
MPAGRVSDRPERYVLFKRKELPNGVGADYICKRRNASINGSFGGGKETGAWGGAVGGCLWKRNSSFFHGEIDSMLPPSIAGIPDLIPERDLSRHGEY